MEAFYLDTFNECIYPGELYETLDELVDVIYENGGRWYEVAYAPRNTTWDVRIEINDNDSLVIDNIAEEIDTDPKHSEFYVLVNAELSEYHWVIAKQKRIFSKYLPDEMWF